LSNLATYKNRYSFSGGISDALWAVGSNEIFEQDAQLSFMKRVGLKPSDIFLDLGCGCLRGSAKIVDYLNAGNFYGADISDGLIDIIPMRLELLGITKKPNIYLINDYDFFGLIGKKFDYVLSVSILTHLLPGEIAEFFSGVSKILTKNGVYYFTIYPTTQAEFVGDIEQAEYNIEWLIKTGRENGLNVFDIPGDYKNPSPIPELNLIDRVNTPEMAQWVMGATLAREV